MSVSEHSVINLGLPGGDGPAGEGGRIVALVSNDGHVLFAIEELGRMVRFEVQAEGALRYLGEADLGLLASGAPLLDDRVFVHGDRGLLFML